MDTAKALKPYEIFTKLMSLGKSMRAHCHRAVEKDGLSLNETDVLLSLAADPENDTVKAISESSNISKGNISGAVESLKEKGLVNTEVLASDRRVMKVTLTEKARPILQKLQNAEEEFFSKFLNALTTVEVPTVNKIFQSVQKFSPKAFLSKITKEGEKLE